MKKHSKSTASTNGQIKGAKNIIAKLGWSDETKKSLIRILDFWFDGLGKTPEPEPNEVFLKVGTNFTKLVKSEELAKECPQTSEDFKAFYDLFKRCCGEAQEDFTLMLGCSLVTMVYMPLVEAEKSTSKND